MNTPLRLAPRTALFLPASNPRAIAKARDLATDMVILDLEDAVKPDEKDSARDAAVAAVREGFGTSIAAVRINPAGSPHHGADMVAIRDAGADLIVVPKVETPRQISDVHSITQLPTLPMIETPRGVLAAASILGTAMVRGVIVGTNDLRAQLRIPGQGRAGLDHALQSILLAARAAGVWAIDGVFNTLDDAAGLEKECRAGRALGYDGKALIHPNQIDIARTAFSPTPEEIEEARALIAAATGGAERFRDRMIESMHVDQARAILARAQ